MSAILFDGDSELKKFCLRYRADVDGPLQEYKDELSGKLTVSNVGHGMYRIKRVSPHLLGKARWSGFWVEIVSRARGSRSLVRLVGKACGSGSWVGLVGRNHW